MSSSSGLQLARSDVVKSAIIGQPGTLRAHWHAVAAAATAAATSTAAATTDSEKIQAVAQPAQDVSRQ